MERKKASDFPPEVLGLFDGYVHGSITRREFLDRAARFAVGGVSAAAMLQSLSPNFAWAQQVAKDDPRIATEYLTYPSPAGSGTLRGYFARPATPGAKRPGVVVFSENRGLSPYIEDVARRLALHDFVAFAPDALTPLGGYPGDEDKGRELYAQLDAGKRTEDFLAAGPYLRSRIETTGAVGAVGFCSGGDMVNLLAARFPELRAGVPFYGIGPGADAAAKIRSPLQMHFAGNDARVNSKWPEYEAVLKANAVKYEAHTYPNTQHGFHNDSTPRYDEAAAKLAWSRTVAFFNANLR